MATIGIRRPNQYADWLRKYTICVDGRPVGDIGAGSEIKFEVSPGRRAILAKIDWCRSNAIEVNVKDGIECTLEVGSNLTGWRFFLGLLYVAFWKSQYLYLREAQAID
jgi:hypothetical protein